MVDVLIVVQKMKGLAKALSLLGLLLVIGYFTARMIQTNKANEVADAFFAQFSVDPSVPDPDHLIVIDQKANDAQAIIERHEAALRNFSYEKSKPDINLMLNSATVSVSWHLTVVLKRSSSAWHISFLNEYLPDKKT